MAGVLLGDHEVEVAREGLVERRLGLALGDDDGEAGVLAFEHVEGAGQQGEGDRLEDGDPHDAGRALQRGGELGVGEFEPFEDVGGVRHEDLGLRGQLQPPPRLAQQRHPGLPFEERQLLRHRRRRLVQCGGDGGDRAAQAQLAQEREAADVEHARSLRRSDGYCKEFVAIPYGMRRRILLA